MQLRHRLFSAISWRVEAKMAALPAPAGLRGRRRCGQIMRWAGAYDCLPSIPNRAAILCFHAITPQACDPQVECEAMSVRELRRLLRVLKRSFRIVALAEVVEAIRAGRPLAPKSIVLTFDDGYANHYRLAAEELAGMKVPWSAFLPAMLVETGARQWTDDVRMLIHRGSRRRLVLRWGDEELALDLTTPEQRRAAAQQVIQRCRYQPDDIRRRRLEQFHSHYAADELESLRGRYPALAPMNWEQARDLKAAGVDVGSHGLSHVALGPQSADRIRHEVMAARDLLQRRIGDHCPHFSYPYGRGASMSAASDAVLAEVGYHCGLTLEADVVTSPATNVLRLPRIIVSPQAHRALFGLWQRFNR